MRFGNPSPAFGWRVLGSVCVALGAAASVPAATIGEPELRIVDGRGSFVDTDLSSGRTAQQILLQMKLRTGGEGRFVFWRKVTLEPRPAAERETALSIARQLHETLGIETTTSGVLKELLRQNPQLGCPSKRVDERLPLSHWEQSPQRLGCKHDTVPFYVHELQYYETARDYGADVPDRLHELLRSFADHGVELVDGEVRPVAARAGAADAGAAPTLIDPLQIEGFGPRYPREARRSRISAMVYFDSVIRVDGTLGGAVPVGCELSEPRETDLRPRPLDDPLCRAFFDAVLSVVAGWRFDPAREDGVPVESEYPFSYHFIPRD